MIIEHPHGYLRDTEGDVVLRFANWTIGDHAVPDEGVSVDYVDGPNEHSEPVADKYRSDP